MFKTLSLIITTALLSAILTVAGLGYYVWKYNPLNIQECMIGGVFNEVTVTEPVLIDDEEVHIINTEESEVFNLSAEQESLLEKAGVSKDSLPSVISPELEACFEEKLGADRVEEIKGGDIPGPFELIKAKGCL